MTTGWFPWLWVAEAQEQGEALQPWPKALLGRKEPRALFYFQG